MPSGSIRDKLARKIDGSGSRRQPIAHVRYIFGEREVEQTQTVRTRPSTPLRHKSVTAPSGQSYRFRGQKQSQRLPVYSVEDVEHFEQSDDFEVRRE